MTHVHDATTDEDVPDFSGSTAPVRFRVNGEEFEAVGELPLLIALALADQLAPLDAPDVTTDERVRIVEGLLRVLLLPDSADRFVARLDDARRPISATRFRQVLAWLLGRLVGGTVTTTGSEVTRG